MTFHNTDYVLTLDVPAAGDALTIEVEDKSDGGRWIGNFASECEQNPLAPAGKRQDCPLLTLPRRLLSDIEEITRKTGNFKKFSVFMKMLSSSLTQESDSVFIDLEMLKNRKSRKPAGAAPGKGNNKRYLILTYAVEFDRNLTHFDPHLHPTA